MKVNIDYTSKKGKFLMFKKLIIVFVVLLFIIICFLYVGKAPQQEVISWGVTFSEQYARDLGLDWQETYLALLDDLGVKKVRIPFYWETLEPEENVYNFEVADWMLQEALRREVEVIPVIGIRIPRWPECHIPLWAKDLKKEKQQEQILGLIEKVVLRYKENESIGYWQVENEPFLALYGECPWYDKNFLKQEIALVRRLDPDTPILISESGELSTWFRGAKVADLVGTSIYRQNWWHRVGGGYYKYPIAPVHYYRKSLLIDKFFNKKVICVELQAEPWGPAPTFILSLEEQAKSMTFEKFKENIDYAKRTGLSEFYFWGAEWWYWMKTVHNQDQYWEEARSLFD